MKIGILRETKIPADTRAPLTPIQCKAIHDELPEFHIMAQPSSSRCFSDNAYQKLGIEVKEDVSDCDFLMGIKEVAPASLLPGKTYFFFSHTLKKQPHNRLLLRTVLEKGITLIDYEILTDSNGIRILGFGRWAGLIGSYLGVRALCMKHGYARLPLPSECTGLKEMMDFAGICPLPPVRIAITGDGRVAGGAEEMMNAFRVQKVTVHDYLTQMNFELPVYAQLDPEKYNRLKNGSSFELAHFFSSPGDYESNFGRFCDRTDLLIMAAYWDPRAPLLFTNQQMKEDAFRISVIADITCDLNGSVPSTIKTTTFENPYYDYNPHNGLAEPAFSLNRNITVMSIDNLPNGLPREASTDFGYSIVKTILPLLKGNDPENILEKATIVKEGKLTKNFEYLYSWAISDNSQL